MAEQAEFEAETGKQESIEPSRDSGDGAGWAASEDRFPEPELGEGQGQGETVEIEGGEGVEPAGTDKADDLPAGEALAFFNEDGMPAPEPVKGGGAEKKETAWLQNAGELSKGIGFAARFEMDEDIEAEYGVAGTRSQRDAGSVAQHAAQAAAKEEGDGRRV